jgi:pimeloyl-ACP methyl ester carboxylesterase
MPCGVPRVIEANGLRLRIQEWGRAGGRPVLLLHSLAAHSHWWDWVAPSLGEDARVVALDLRGHGGSDWVEPAAYRAPDYAADVVAVLDRLGAGTPLVVGHSLGGYVGATLAALHPERVGGLVIVDTMTEWNEVETAWALEQAKRPGQEFVSREEAGARFRLSPRETTAPAAWLRHLGEMGVRESRPGVWQPVFDRRVFAHAKPDAWPILAGVTCPTLVVRGAGSPIMSHPAGRRVAETVKHGRLAEIEGAYHHLILDDPSRFVALVRSWLADGMLGFPS